MTDRVPPAADPDRSVTIDFPPDGWPPMLFLAERRLTCQGMHNLRKSVEYAMQAAKPFVIDGGFEVFQLIDGQWRPLREPRAEA